LPGLEIGEHQSARLEHQAVVHGSHCARRSSEASQERHSSRLRRLLDKTGERERRVAARIVQ